METQHIYLHWFVQQRFSHVSCFSFATVFSLVFVVVLFFFMLLWILKFYYQLLVKSFQIFLKKSDKTFLVMISSVQSLSRVRLCNPMNCSMPGLPVHHQLPEFTQTRVHWVSDAFHQECSNIMALFIKYPFNFISQFLFVGQNQACSDYVGRKWVQMK